MCQILPCRYTHHVQKVLNQTEFDIIVCRLGLCWMIQDWKACMLSALISSPLVTCHVSRTHMHDVVYVLCYITLVNRHASYITNDNSLSSASKLVSEWLSRCARCVRSRQMLDPDVDSVPLSVVDGGVGLV